MIQHIVSFVFYTEADDIDQSSTSLDWIFSYLKQHYNIQAKGANFLKITEHNYTSCMLPQVFYKQFRASFLNNLRKKNEKVTHKGGMVLQEDETLSPSFEDAIVLWCLEKIDPRLPSKVRKDYEHRLTGDTYLIDLQATIFQSIPSMLEDLDRHADANAATVPPDDTGDTSISVLRPFTPRNRPYQSHRGRGGPQTRRPGYVQRSCSVCKATGKPEQVYKTHNVGTCGFFNRQDRQDLLSASQSMSVADQEEDNGNWSIESEELQHEHQDD